MAVTAPLPVLTIDQQEAPTVNRIVGVSATLAANEALAERRRRGERVLPLAFGEAGVPVAPVLRDALATDSRDPAGVYFGTRSGRVYGSRDEGASWKSVVDGLPPVVSVKAVVLGGKVGSRRAARRG